MTFNDASQGPLQQQQIQSSLHTTGCTTLNGTITATGDLTYWDQHQWNTAEQARQQAAMQQAMNSYALTVRNQGPQQQEKREPMRGLFEVFVVNPESGEIVKRDVVVADSDKKAELKVMRAIDDDPDDVDIIVRRFGDVRPKRKVQEVKVVKE